eukprot:5803119-Prymnesium_polylepis.2
MRPLHSGTRAVPIASSRPLDASQPTRGLGAASGGVPGAGDDGGSGGADGAHETAGTLQMRLALTYEEPPVPDWKNATDTVLV